jgi:hypothetical protein
MVRTPRRYPVATLARNPSRRLWWLTLVAATFVLAGLFVAPAPPAVAGTGGCYGASCTGLNPAGRCDGDAYTVRSIAINSAALYLGQLDLRYSPSCKANWGRFSTASGARYVTLWETNQPIPFGGRVTAWNPGGPSQQPVQANYTCSAAPYSSCSFWSKMVDGRGTACTGVEPWTRTLRGNAPESKGWYWGPCA